MLIERSKAGGAFWTRRRQNDRRPRFNSSRPIDATRCGASRPKPTMANNDREPTCPAWIDSRNGRRNSGRRRRLQAFEATIISDYCAETAVARELVLRLASLLWRLRRATAIETDLLEIQAEALRERRLGGPPNGAQMSDDAVHGAFKSTPCRGDLKPVGNVAWSDRGEKTAEQHQPDRTDRAAAVIVTTQPANWLTASCVSPISTAACSSASTAMKLLFGGRPCRRYSLFIRSDSANPLADFLTACRAGPFSKEAAAEA